MLALSTTWNAHRHTDGEQLVREILEQGFTAVALGSGTRVSLVAGMKRMICKGRIRAVAVEGFFPAPPGYSEHFRSRFHLSARDPGDRRKAVQWTAQTLDYAAEFCAGIVLLELGSSPLKGFTASLASLAQLNRLYSRSYVRLKLRGARRRAQASARCLERIGESLETLMPLARSRGLRLALTGQGSLEAIPNEDEIESLLQTYRESGCLGYWHDFGAAQVKANLGFAGQVQWLGRMRQWLLGGYVNDVAWPDQKNLLPFGGMVEYHKLVPALPQAIPLVWKIPSLVPSLELSQAWLAWNEEFSRIP